MSNLLQSKLLLTFDVREGEHGTLHVYRYKDFYAIRWCPFYKCTIPLVIHKKVWDKGKAHNVLIRKNSGDTAIVVLPNGDKTLLYVYGEKERTRRGYMTSGIYMYEVFEEIKQYVLISHDDMSHGGGIRHRLWLIAVPSDLPLDTKIGCVMIDEKYHVLLASGDIVEP